MTVTVDDVLSHLVSRSAAPSSFGAQLDRLRFGTTSAPDPFRAREEAEDRMLEQASVLRATSEFASRQELRGNSATTYRGLEKIQRATHLKLPQGLIAIQSLSAFQEWSTKSTEKGLVSVYQYLHRIAPTLAPSTDPDLVSAFRQGKAKRARDLSAEVYADALLALAAFLVQFNRRGA